MFLQEVAAKSAVITRASNGWIVTIAHPAPPAPEPGQAMLAGMAEILPIINKVAGKGAIQGIDEEIDPWKRGDGTREENLREDIDKAKEEIAKEFRQPVRTGPETHVFIEPKEMLAFLQQFMVDEL